MPYNSATTGCYQLSSVSDTSDSAPIEGAVFYGDHIRQEFSSEWTGQNSSGAGSWMSAADVNGDHITDLIIGNPSAVRVDVDKDTASSTDPRDSVMLPPMGGAFVIYGGSRVQKMDVNMDGVVTMADVDAYQCYLDPQCSPSSDELRIVDLNNDGNFDASEVLIILKEVLDPGPTQ